MTSAVSEWSCVRELNAMALGLGIDSAIVTSKGRRSSINSSSGGRDKGESIGYARVCSIRVWCSRCVESAVCAVASLHRH